MQEEGSVWRLKGLVELVKHSFLEMTKELLELKESREVE